MVSISRFDISTSVSVLTKYFVTSTWIGRIGMPCAHAQWVIGQWPLSVYEVSVLTWPSAPAHTTCRIGLLLFYQCCSQLADNYFRKTSSYYSMGGDLGGLGGRSPKNLRWEDGPCIRPSNILRSSVCRMRAKAQTE